MHSPSEVLLGSGNQIACGEDAPATVGVNLW